MSALWAYIQGKITSSLYWGNINVSSTSSTTKEPTFGDVHLVAPTSADHGRVNFYDTTDYTKSWGFVGPSRDASSFGIYVHSTASGASNAFYAVKYTKSDKKINYADAYNYHATYLAGSQTVNSTSWFATWDGYDIKSITTANAATALWDDIDAKITANRIASGTTNRLAYYSAANKISPVASVNISGRGFTINDGNSTWPGLIYYNGSNTWINAT